MFSSEIDIRQNNDRKHNEKSYLRSEMHINYIIANKLYFLFDHSFDNFWYCNFAHNLYTSRILGDSRSFNTDFSKSTGLFI